MSTKNFRIGLVFTPTSLVSAGVLNTNQKDAYAFMEQIQPLIEDFMDRIRKWRSASGTNRTNSSAWVRGEKRVPVRCNDDAHDLKTSRSEAKYRTVPQYNLFADCARHIPQAGELGEARRRMGRSRDRGMAAAAD